MKSSSLHALVIDRHFGELSPEAVELLELHLASHPAAQAEAARILESLAVTGAAVMQHPELGHVPPVLAKPVLKPQRKPVWTPWLARAAVVALACTLGFLMGRAETRPAASSSASQVASAPPMEARKDSPWARYRMSFDPAGEGLQVVRVDSTNLQPNAIR